MIKKSVMSETLRRSRITTSFALFSRQICAARWARTDEGSEVVVFIRSGSLREIVDGTSPTARVRLLSIMRGDELQHVFLTHSRFRYQASANRAYGEGQNA